MLEQQLRVTSDLQVAGREKERKAGREGRGRGGGGGEVEEEEEKWRPGTGF